MKFNRSICTFVTVLILAYMTAPSLLAVEPTPPKDYEETLKEQEYNGGTWADHLFNRYLVESENLDDEGTMTFPVYGMLDMLDNYSENDYKLDIDGDGNGVRTGDGTDVTFAIPGLIRAKVTSKMSVLFVTSDKKSLDGTDMNGNQLRETAWLKSPKGTIENLGTTNLKVEVSNMKDLGDDTSINWYKPSGEQTRLTLVDKNTPLTDGNAYIGLTVEDTTISLHDVSRSNVKKVKELLPGKSSTTFTLEGNIDDSLVEALTYEQGDIILGTDQPEQHVQDNPLVAFNITWRFTRLD